MPPPAPGDVASAGAPGPDFLALAEGFRCHERPLRALAARMLGNANDVDDVLQDAYLRAHRGFARFRGDASLGSWLYRIVSTTCLDELRRRRTTEELPEVVSPASDPAEVAGSSADLAAALGTLNRDQRAALVLVDGLGYDYTAAGEALAVATGTIASRLNRGRGTLRAALREAA